MSYRNLTNISINNLTQESYKDSFYHIMNIIKDQLLALLIFAIIGLLLYWIYLFFGDKFFIKNFKRPFLIIEVYYLFFINMVIFAICGIYFFYYLGQNINLAYIIPSICTFLSISLIGVYLRLKK